MHEPRETMNSQACQPGAGALLGGTPELARRSAPTPVQALEELLEQAFEDRVSGAGDPPASQEAVPEPTEMKGDIP